MDFFLNIYYPEKIYPIYGEHVQGKATLVFDMPSIKYGDQRTKWKATIFSLDLREKMCDVNLW